MSRARPTTSQCNPTSVVAEPPPAAATGSGGATRRERIDRGIKVRSDDIFVLASLRDLAWVVLPRGLATAALLLFPLMEERVGPYWQTVLLNTMVIALLALSWDLLASVGLVSLGQSLFLGLGGYVAGAVNAWLGWGPLLSIPVATALGALIATLVLYPLLRLRGVYFGLVTFALPLLFMRVIETTGAFGGTEGLSGLTPLPSRTVELYLVTGAALCTTVAFRRLIATDFGLVFHAVRDNERAVVAAGFDVQRVKAQAVFIAALPAAFAGAFVTHRYQFVGMPAFALEYSTLPLISAVVGGAGSFLGPLVGSFILVPLSEAMREFGSLRVVLYSLVLLVFTVGLPEGLFRYAARKYGQTERRVALDEAPR